MPIPPQAIFSVSEFLELTNTMLEPLVVTVRGEVTSAQARGVAVYFTLADKKESAVLNCLIWKNRLARTGLTIEPGMEVQVVGNPNIYKPSGRFSFMADTISPVGEGALRQAFEKLKAKLEQAGYFDAARKRSLPRYPQTIGLLTSSQGEAIQDFRTHLGNFGFNIIHADIRVEGIHAIDSIVQALTWFNQQPQPPELLVLTRGGGSLESLQAFNSEAVANAILASKIPVVSAVGHENDVTIADLVADVRASTPTDAGKLISEHWRLVGRTLTSHQQLLVHVVGRVLDRNMSALSHVSDSIFQRFLINTTQQQQRLNWLRQSLFGQMQKRRQHLVLAQTRFLHNTQRWQLQHMRLADTLKTTPQLWNARMDHALQRSRDQLKHSAELLQQADPLHKLKQGYSIALVQGRVVKSIQQLKPHDLLTIKVADGEIQSEVRGIS